MAVSRGLKIYRPAQIKTLNDGFRPEIKFFTHQTGQVLPFFVYRLNHQRLGTADCVSNRNKTFFRETVRHDIFRGESRHVRGRTVNFRRVFSGKTSAAVRNKPAVSVNHYFSAGQTGISREAALHELAGRIDQNLYVKNIADRRADKLFNHRPADFRVRNLLVVLTTYQHGFDFIAVHGHLRFSVRLEPKNFSVLSQMLQSLC